LNADALCRSVASSAERRELLQIRCDVQRVFSAAEAVSDGQELQL
jgi:hypothetical protein